MKPIAILQGAAAFALTVLLLPLVIKLCRRWRVLDFPGPLKIHARPTPRLGGVAVAVACGSIGLLYNPRALGTEWPFFASLALIWTSGLIDDIRGLSPILRLAAQILAAILLWTAGWRVPVPFAGVLSLFVTALFVVAFVNSFNFMDGADGIVAGVGGVIAAAYAVFPGGASNFFASGIAFVLAGTCGGLLVYNFPPAKIFCGDSGSTALGFLAAFLALDFWRSQPLTAPVLLFPFLLSALPLLDAALAVIRRLRRRTSPFEGDRSHSYDLLLARGFSPVQVALLCYVVVILLAGVAWKELAMSPAQACVATILSFAALVVVEVWLGSLQAGHSDRRSPVSLRADPTKRAPVP